MNLFIYKTDYKAREAFLQKLMELEDKDINFRAYHNNKVLITDTGDTFRFTSSREQNLRGHNPKHVFIDEGVELTEALTRIKERTI